MSFPVGSLFGALGTHQTGAFVSAAPYPVSLRLPFFPWVISIIPSPFVSWAVNLYSFLSLSFFKSEDEMLLPGLLPPKGVFWPSLSEKNQNFPLSRKNSLSGLLPCKSYFGPAPVFRKIFEKFSGGIHPNWCATPPIPDDRAAIPHPFYPVFFRKRSLFRGEKTAMPFPSTGVIARHGCK